MERDELRARFERASRAAGASRPADSAFDELVSRYGEGHRHYHTLEHVAACLRGLDRWGELAERPAEVELALWYHDVIYTPTATDNEQRSAELAAAHLGALEVDRSAIERIGGHIEATRRHVATTGADVSLVIDLDLGILGARWPDFDRFERRIRQEYAHVPEPLYRLGRRHVLTGFLDRAQIYKLGPIRDELEVPARANLQRAVAQL